MGLGCETSGNSFHNLMVTIACEESVNTSLRILQSRRMSRLQRKDHIHA